MRRRGARVRPAARPLHATSGEAHELECDVIAGCDGFHGVSRPAIPRGRPDGRSSRDYPFGWLGILAAVAPSNDELDLRAPRARVRAPQPALAEAEPPLHPVRPGRGHRGLARRADLGGAPRSGSACDGWTLAEGPVLEKGDHADAQLRHRADAATGTSSSPAMRPTSCRRRARRASTSRSRTSRCSPSALVAGTRRQPRRCSTRTRRPACAASGAPSTSRWWMTTMLHRPPERRAVRSEAAAVAAALRDQLARGRDARWPRTTSASSICPAMPGAGATRGSTLTVWETRSPSVVSQASGSA